VPVDTWNTGWGGSTTEDELYTVAGNAARMYFNLNFVGIQFLTQTIDASAMTHLHLDVYAPAGTDFKVKVVAYSGDNGTYLGEAELTFDADSTPAFRAGEWSSLDIPLASFPLAAPWTHLAQLVLSSSTTQLVLVDNVYWHK
jgi:2',3'-cyclic-nucleotide 2'-phosphodiesterase (5'-nucleotidase family)